MDGSGCLIWRGYRNPQRYGMLSINGKMVPAHRIVYKWTYGTEALPTVDHLCRIRFCVNPEHLEAVSLIENVMRGNAPPAKNARKTHCERGHEFTEQNTYVYSNGRRRGCIKCRKMHTQKLTAKRRRARQRQATKGPTVTANPLL